MPANGLGGRAGGAPAVGAMAVRGVEEGVGDLVLDAAAVAFSGKDGSGTGFLTFGGLSLCTGGHEWTRRDAGSDVPPLHLLAFPHALCRLGASPRHCRCCLSTAAATPAAAGTWFRRRCARNGASSARTCAGAATASGGPCAVIRCPLTSVISRSSSIGRTWRWSRSWPIRSVATSACATIVSIPTRSASWWRSRGWARRRR